MTCLRSLLLLGILAVAGPAPAATWIVDDDGLGGPHDCGTENPALRSVQAGVNVALPGDTIYVCPGIYTEQIEIFVRDIAIRGAGRDRTVIRPAQVVANSSTLSGDTPVAGIIVVDGARGVTLSDLSVDGGEAGFGKCTPAYVGIFYRASSGAVRRTRIHDVFDEKARHCENVHGVLVEGAPDGELVTIANNRVDRFGTSGITAEAPAVEVRVTGNTVLGRGPLGRGDTAQTGIRIAAKTGSLVDGNRIFDHRYEPDHSASCGILVRGHGADGEPTGRNTFSNNERNVCRESFAPRS